MARLGHDGERLEDRDTGIEVGRAVALDGGGCLVVPVTRVHPEEDLGEASTHEMSAADRTLRVLSEGKPMAKLPSGSLPPDLRIRQVQPGAGDSAWILADDGTVLVLRSITSHPQVHRFHDAKAATLRLLDDRRLAVVNERSLARELLTDNFERHSLQTYTIDAKPFAWSAADESFWLFDRPRGALAFHRSGRSTKPSPSTECTESVQCARPVPGTTSCWVGWTSGGLALVDGTRPLAHPTMLEGVGVRELHLSSSGDVLWILSSAGSVYVQPTAATGPTGPAVPVTTPTAVTGLHPVQRGATVWATLAGGGLCHIDAARTASGAASAAKLVADVTSVRSVHCYGDAEPAWVVTNDGHLYRVEPADDSRVDAVTGKVGTGLVEGFAAVEDVVPASRVAWIIGKDKRLFCAAGRTFLNDAKPFALLQQRLRPRPAPGGRGGWILGPTGDCNFYFRVCGDPNDGFSGKLLFGNERSQLSHDSRVPAELPVDLLTDPDRDVRIDLQWPQRPDAKWNQFGESAHVGVWGSGRCLAEATTNYRDWMRSSLHCDPTGRSALTSAGEYTVTLRCWDRLGTDMSLRWGPVRLRRALVDRLHASRSFMTSAAIVVTIGLAGVAVASLRRMPTLFRWAPPGLFVATGAAAWFPDIQASYNIDRFWFLTALATAVVIAIGTGLVSPAAFRTLSGIRPIDRFAPAAARLPWLRRRLYAEHIDGLMRVLAEQRKESKDESYVAMPVCFKAVGTQAGPAIGPDQMVAGAPAVILTELLTNPNRDEAESILIESPGGRGKTALLREIVFLAISRFQEDPSRPIPVLILNKSAEPMDSLVRDSLGRSAVSEQVFEAEMASGGFIPVIDGLTESEIKPEAISSFLSGNYGEKTRVLVSMRPSQNHRKPFSYHSHRWLLVEPLRLTDETLAAFASHYFRADANNAEAERQRAAAEERGGGRSTDGLPDTEGVAQPSSGQFALSEAARRACKCSMDNSYFPILVRLAVKYSPEAGDVPSIYEGAFNSLLSQVAMEEPLIVQAGRLCIETYWDNGGQRELPYASVDGPRRALLDALRQCGVLVAATTAGRRRDKGVDSEEPRTLRFFHDSMQSYLTARALASAGRWTDLARAAGDEAFIRAESDLGTGTGSGSELFRMCMYTFEPKDQLRRFLYQQLRGWAREHHSVLQLAEVYAAVPEQLRADLQSSLGPEPGTAAFIRAAAEACKNGGVSELSYLYERLARRLYDAVPHPEQLGVVVATDD